MHIKNILSLQRSLLRITIALNIYNFASSLVGVFIPLVILQSGGQMREVPAFYLVYAIFKLLINYSVVLFIQKKGAHAGVGMAFVAGALQMASILGFATKHEWILLAAGAISLSFTNALLWNSQHFFISKAMQDNSKSSSMATIAIINQLTGVAAPLLGGLIGTYLGLGFLLSLAVALCLVALFPLRGMGRDWQPESDVGPTISYNFSGAPIRDLLANFSFNIETAIGVMVWPIYLAVSVAKYNSIGLITAIAAIVSIVVTWLAGHRGDRGKDRSVLWEGVAISSIVDVGRIFVSSQFWILAVSSVYKASLSYFGNAWVSTYYHHAKKNGLQYIMSMEIACDLAYVALWSVLLIVLLSTSSKVFFVAAFVIAAIAAWGCLLVTNQGSLESDVS